MLPWGMRPRLASLSLSDASMGAFFSDVFDYRANVGSGITSTMIRAPPENPRATIRVSATGASLQREGTWVVSLGAGRQCPFDYGHLR